MILKNIFALSGWDRGQNISPICMFKLSVLRQNMHICFENSRFKDNCDFALDQYFVGALKHRQNQECSTMISACV